MSQLILTLIVFLFPLAYSPGPGNMFFAANAARFGFRATIPANLGYHVATWLVATGIGFGFASVMERSPHALQTFKIAGGLYVLWIAWKMIRAGALNDQHTARAASFLDGAILLVLNPKGYTIMALMFSQFLAQSVHGYIWDVLLISTVFTLNNLVAFIVWIIIGDKIAAFFRTPESAHRLNIIFGTVLACVAIWMLAL